MATLQTTALRVGGVSWLVPLRALAVTATGLGLLFLLVAVDLSVGDFPIPLGDVVHTLIGGGDAGQRFVVMELRLPQTAVAVAVGAALGLAGALTQTVARNPLASPDILGVTEGAAFGAVAVIVLSGASGYGGGLVTGRLQELGLPLAAFGGAILTAMLLYLFSWRRGGWACGSSSPSSASWSSRSGWRRCRSPPSARSSSSRSWCHRSPCG